MLAASFNKFRAFTKHTHTHTHTHTLPAAAAAAPSGGRHRIRRLDEFA